MRFFRNEKGFTLIELMVVILILGILVAIAVPIFNNARASAWQRTCQANLRTLDGAVQTYAADNPGATFPQNYPQNYTDLENALKGKYVKEMPHCPQDSSKDYVVTPASGNTLPPIISCPNDSATHKYP